MTRVVRAVVVISTHVPARLAVLLVGLLLTGVLISTFDR